MKRVVGYGCTKNNKLSVRNQDEYKNTKAYKQLKNFFLSDENIYIDILTVAHKERKVLLQLIDELKEGDTIVITNTNAFGNNKKDILDCYIKFYENKVGVLILDEKNSNGISDLSTTNYTYSVPLISREEFSNKCNDIIKSKQKTNKGRPKGELNDDFIKIYWLYERFLIEESVAYSNKFFHLSKGGFHKIAEIYEASNRYKDDEKKQDEEYNILNIVKRRGAVNDKFRELFNEFSETEIKQRCVTQDMIDIACDKIGVRRLSDISFYRYYIKAVWGRKASVSETINRRDKKLNESLKPDDK